MVEAPLYKIENTQHDSRIPFRDQGVGGSNPLSPTILFKPLQQIQTRTFWVQFVQLAIAVPQACGNRGQPAQP